MALQTTVIIECDVCSEPDAEPLHLAVADLAGDVDLCTSHRKAFDEAIEPWLQVLDRVVAVRRAAFAEAVRPRRSRRPIARVPCPHCPLTMPRGNLARHVAASHPDA